MKNQSLLLISIFLLTVVLRLYGLNWDQGFHLHPDERAIVMFTLPLHIPNSFTEFFSPSSPWNPHFFAYGSFPLYLLKIVSSLLGIFDPQLSEYNYINLVGRVISAFADIGTIFLIFLLGKKLFSVKHGILAAFFYAISVFPIQASHFYAVDSLLTFFIVLTLFALLRFYENSTKKNALFAGMAFGFALATKVSAIVLIFSIGMALFADFLLIFIKSPHKPHIWFPHLPKLARRLFVDGLIIIFITFITFVILEPYSIIDFNNFLSQNLQQSQMTKDAFTFPYTLQYVGKIPYWHELKNIFLWGQGPILAALSFAGALYVTYKTIKQPNRTIIFLVFFWAYFFTVGKFAVGWMRYMLPLYPLFCLFGAVFTLRLFNLFLNFSFSQFSIFNSQFEIKSQFSKFKFLNIKNSLKISNFKFQIIIFIFLVGVLAWPLSFMHIYTQPNTRFIASGWINKNIPAGKTLAIEHWDDGLPLFGGEKYRIITLPLYEADTPQKWAGINQQLATTDYIIIASNRLYVPLQKLSDCRKYPNNCYPKTALYYQNLFSGRLGFEKVKEFTSYPTIPIFNIPIIDDTADESFTVYDHPKVIIYQKKSYAQTVN